MKTLTYYVYAYLDPRKPGCFTFPGVDFTFPFLPFYIGKGHGNRYLHHLRIGEGSRKSSFRENTHKLNIIKKLLQEGTPPIILFVFKDLDEKDADEKEELCIRTIGRELDGAGPLTNLALGDPFKGKLVLRGEQHPGFGKPRSPEVREKISKNHKDVSGKNNSKAKRWKLVSPTGEIFFVEGTLKAFCEDHNLALGILKRLLGQGPYELKRFTHTKGRALNTVGWSSEEL